MACLSAVAVGLASVPAAAVEDSRLHFENEYWSVFENADNCAMVATYGETDSLWLSINQRVDTADLRIVAAGLGRLTDGREVRYTVMFIDMEGDANSEWPDAWFSAFAMPDNRYGIGGSFALGDFSRDFNRFELMGVTQGDSVITSMTLKGASEAFAQLRSCDTQLERRMPTDPVTKRR